MQACVVGLGLGMEVVDKKGEFVIVCGLFLLGTGPSHKELHYFLFFKLSGGHLSYEVPEIFRGWLL